MSSLLGLKVSTHWLGKKRKNKKTMTGRVDDVIRHNIMQNLNYYNSKTMQWYRQHMANVQGALVGPRTTMGLTMMDRHLSPLPNAFTFAFFPHIIGLVGLFGTSIPFLYINGDLLWFPVETVTGCLDWGDAFSLNCIAFPLCLEFSVEGKSCAHLVEWYQLLKWWKSN